MRESSGKNHQARKVEASLKSAGFALVIRLGFAPGLGKPEGTRR